MKAYYIYRAGRQPDGPYSPAQIVSMMERKEILGAALVWCEGMNQWIPLYKVLDDIHPQSNRRNHQVNPPSGFKLTKKRRMIIGAGIGFVALLFIILLAGNEPSRQPYYDRGYSSSFPQSSYSPSMSNDEAAAIGMLIGAGMATQAQRQAVPQQALPCLQCDGTGILYSNGFRSVCPNCGGQGRVYGNPQAETIKDALRQRRYY